ncbi:hypothetical protein M2375_003675 [Comamonas sp. BIGb0152]|nr:hypothetical protein [Comamonas sp. BIGb0152]
MGIAIKKALVSNVSFCTRGYAMHFVNVLRVGILSAGLISSGLTNAAVETFFGEDAVNGSSVASRPQSDAARDAFVARLNGANTENFDSIGTGTTAPFSVNMGASGTATLSGSASINSTSGAGRFATSGSNYIETNTNFTISFSLPQTAFGFYATDISDFGGQLSITYSDGTSSTVSVPHRNPAADGSVFYYGLIDTENPFVSVVFNNSNADDFFGFDDLTAGTAAQVIPPVSIATASLPPGMQGKDYAPFTVEATGGLAPLTWSASNLPAGLVLDPVTGVISGKPTESGTFTVEISASDSSSPTALSDTKSFTIEVTAAQAPAAPKPVPSLGTWATFVLSAMVALLGWKRRRPS